jgi:hypothetical protein
MYVGDGTSNCTRIVPQMLGLWPAMGPKAGGTLVTIRYSYAFTNQTRGYCRFGRYYVAASKIEKSRISCVTPPSPAVRQFVSISFDGIGWSEYDGFFDFEAGPEDIRTFDQMPFVRSGIVIGIACIASLFGRNRQKRNSEIGQRA